MLRLDLTKKTIAFLDKLPPKQFKQISKKIFSLMANPKPHDSKGLKGTLTDGQTSENIGLSTALKKIFLKLRLSANAMILLSIDN